MVAGAGAHLCGFIEGVEAVLPTRTGAARAPRGGHHHRAVPIADRRQRQRRGVRRGGGESAQERLDRMIGDATHGGHVGGLDRDAPYAAARTELN